MGCAVGKSPLGPFVPQKNNPILRSTTGLVTGTGHGCVVEGPHDSLWAFYYKGALPESLKDGLLGDNLHTYAWVWLIVAVLLFVSSWLLLSRNQFARWVGFVAATVGALSAMTWMPYYPVWSLTYVGLAVLTFYALAVHGGRK